jgi:subtilase family serine protease
VSAQLSSQINSLKQEDAKLKADIEALQGQLGNATNIAYVAIVIAIVLGAAAIVLARKRE